MNIKTASTQAALSKFGEFMRVFLEKFLSGRDFMAALVEAFRSAGLTPQNSEIIEGLKNVPLTEDPRLMLFKLQQSGTLERHMDATSKTLEAMAKKAPRDALVAGEFEFIAKLQRNSSVKANSWIIGNVVSNVDSHEIYDQTSLMEFRKQAGLTIVIDGLGGSEDFDKPGYIRRGFGVYFEENRLMGYVLYEWNYDKEKMVPITVATKKAYGLKYGALRAFVDSYDILYGVSRGISKMGLKVAKNPLKIAEGANEAFKAVDDGVETVRHDQRVSDELRDIGRPTDGIYLIPKTLDP